MPFRVFSNRVRAVSRNRERKEKEKRVKIKSFSQQLPAATDALFTVGIW